MATETISPTTAAEQSKRAGDERSATPEVKALARIGDLLECIRQELVAVRTSIDTLTAS